MVRGPLWAELGPETAGQGRDNGKGKSGRSKEVEECGEEAGC